MKKRLCTFLSVVLFTLVISPSSIINADQNNNSSQNLTTDKPTLESQQNSLETSTVLEPVFSQKGGFYTEEFDLKLSSTQEGVKIYYTTDGSEPLPGSESTLEYTGSINVKSRAGDPNILSMISGVAEEIGPIWHSWAEPNGEVFKCTTMRAAAFKEDGTKSKTVTYSYFVDKDIFQRYNLPVISLVTDKSNLFDDEKGIYMALNCEKRGDEWERPVNVEFFEKDGTLEFSKSSGIRINGGFNRKLPQKSLRLYADHGYDEDNKFRYEIFPGLKKEYNGKTLDNFTRLILRNAGDDGDDITGGAFIRDPLMHNLVSHLNISTQACRYAVVFLDGEFWGVYNIRERYDDEYFKSHYNIDKDKTIILDVLETIDVQTGEAGDEKSYTEDVIDYLHNNSINSPGIYENIKTKIDIENFIQYYSAQIYFGNFDWPGNNLYIWKCKTDDGKYHPEAPLGKDGRWRWLLKDTDFSFGLTEWALNKGVDFDTLAYATADQVEQGNYPYVNYPWAVFLFKTLLQNNEFRNQFINTFADQLNTSFDPVRVKNEIEKLKTTIEKAMPEQYDRWNALSIPEWANNVDYLKNYAELRPSNVRQHIINKFSEYGVDKTFELKLNSNLNEGYIRINSIDINSSTPGIENPESWTGVYFNNVPVTLKAIAKSGYRFDHWACSDGTQAITESITFTPSKDINITAVFKKTESSNHIVSGYISTDTSSESGDLKEGFRVYLLGTNISSITDKNGFFKLNDVPESISGYSIGISKPNCLYREMKTIIVTQDITISTQEKPIVMWLGDIAANGVQDKSINMADIIQIAKTFNTIEGDGVYNKLNDLNYDKAINMMDIMILAKHFNSTSLDY